MSYLDPPRLHFAGTFQAAPSTVNNDPLHYDNATFKADYKLLQSGRAPEQWNGWWNPRGDATWRLIACRVTAAAMADGSPAAEDDPVRQLLVADSDRAVAGKLADLDPEQQLVSMIFGFEVRVTTAAGATMLSGQFEPVAFMDIWDRAMGGTGGDIGAGTMYQSVLTGLEWGEVSGSPFLVQLRQAAPNGRLSIKFNVDGYNLNFRSPDFTRGRIVGTIGPAGDGEPEHFVAGRQFMTTASPDSGFFTPVGKLNFCVASLDEGRGKICLDLGNALPAASPGGPMSDLGDVSLVCEVPPAPGEQQPGVLSIGTLRAATYAAANWYEDTAGVVELPAERALTPDEVDAVATNGLAVMIPDGQGQPALGIAESPGGLYVRADQFVFRLDADQEAAVHLHATRFGQPYAGARVIAILDSSQLQGFSPLGPVPDVATPANAIEFAARVVTGESGVAVLPIRAHDPGNPRGFIDGQVYGVRPVLEETIYSPTGHYPFNQWNFVSLLVWDAFVPDDPPTWHGAMRPIFQQYANLYPVMDRIMDLADYDSVSAHRKLLLLAFGLGAGNPNSMPVTRDLSEAKRQAILRWLTDTGDDGRPRKGTPPLVLAAAPAGPAVVPPEPSPEPTVPPVEPQQGGKAAAASRRLALRPPR